jgi:hypothetical protein
MKKISNILLILIIFFAHHCFAWTGFEENSRTMIDIGPGNLTREGLVIEFFDFADGELHDAEVLSMEEDGSFLILVLFDMDLQKERTFLMENQ